VGPGQQASLREREGVEERNREPGEHDGGRVGAGGLELGQGLEDEMAQPAYSANTAPITATATAIFAPLRAAGSAAGASAQRKTCQREASSVRRSLTWSGSTPDSASSVVTTTGKKHTRAMIASLGAMS
jgi:hypothetical protein